MKFPFAEIISYLKSIKEVGDQNKKIIEHLEKNWDLDRKNFRDFEARLSHVEVELKSLAETVSKIPNQTRDRVAEAAEGIIEKAQNLTEAINEKDIVQVNKPIKNKPWYKFWK